MAGIWQSGVMLIVAIFLLPSQAWSHQEPSSIQSPTTTKDADSVDLGASESTDTLSNQQAMRAGRAIPALNSAHLLIGEKGLLQWGWVSVRSLSFQSYYDQIHFEDSTIQPQDQDQTASQLWTAIVVDHQFKRTRFALQYNPSLFFIQGHVLANALNQDLSMDVLFPLNARWTATFTDRFSYYGSQRIFSELSLNADYVTGTIVRQNFTDAPGSILNNQVYASFSYLWSPRTTLTFTPAFGYQHSSSSLEGPQHDVSALYEGGSVAMSHQLSETRTLGVSYSLQGATISGSGSAESLSGAGLSNQVLQDALVTYGQQLRRTWYINLGAGIASNTGSGSIGTSLALQAGITKWFRKVELAASYNQGHQFNGFISNSVSDRVDAVARVQLTRRWSEATSGAYFRQGGGISGLYATEQLRYQLTRHLSTFASFTHLKQSGDGTRLLDATRNVVTAGVTWAPASTSQN